MGERDKERERERQNEGERGKEKLFFQISVQQHLISSVVIRLRFICLSLAQTWSICRGNKDHIGSQVKEHANEMELH